MCYVTKFVEVNDVVGNVRQFEPHKFWVFHWCIEIKIFDVNGHELCISGRDDTAEKYFDGDHVCCGCAAIAWEVNSITADCKANAKGVIVFRAKVGHNTSVCHALPSVLRNT